MVLKLQFGIANCAYEVGASKVIRHFQHQYFDRLSRLLELYRVNSRWTSIFVANVFAAVFAATWQLLGFGV